MLSVAERTMQSNDPKVPGNITGVILAGGSSSRFGGNKALATLGGRPLIAHVADLLGHLFSSVLVVTNTPAQYAFLDLPMTPDLFPGAGPLAGIHAALSVAPEERVFVVACDMPHINPVLVRYLCSLDTDRTVQAVLPRLARGVEPLFGIYHRTLVPGFYKRLEAGHGGVIDALAGRNVRWVEEDEILSVVPSLDSFRNINYQGDLVEITDG